MITVCSKGFMVYYGVDLKAGYYYPLICIVCAVWQSKEELVLRDFNYCIIDEVDSILIDEARTPLIISGQAEAPSTKYYKVNPPCPPLYLFSLGNS
eukprot:scaffold274925_cov31-Prasinocladus_malaysianus.AAC.1